MGRTAPSGGRRPGFFQLIALVTAFCALAAVPRALAQEEWNCTAEAFVIMDADTGKILLAYNPKLMLPPASTVKVMTAMYVLENLKMDDQVRVSAYAAAAPPSKINIKEGESYTVRELLYALLLSSANDGARALAEKVAGSEAGFARRVTERMRQLGAYRTNICTANGLPNDNQFTTAEDLALIFRQAMKNPEFARIMSTKTYEIQGQRELRNHDRFLFTTPLARGGKTGYTRASKHTYVGMFQNQDKAIIVSMLGSKKKWADLRLLIERGFCLAGSPVPKLEPVEERLHFAKKHMGNSIGAGEVSRGSKKKKGFKKDRVKQVSRNSQVSVSSLADMPKKKSYRTR